MTKKVWTAADMGRKGIRKMLEKFDPDPVEARKKIAKKKKRQGANLGGRPVKYPACTFRFGTGELRGCHRFKNGVCDCGQKQK
jgi:hypothetical protein